MTENTNAPADRIDTSKLGYGFITAEAREVDWSDVPRTDDADGDETQDTYTLHLPEPTAEVLAEYGQEPEKFDARDWLVDHIAEHVATDVLLRHAREATADDAEDAVEWIGDQDRWRTLLSADMVEQINGAMAAAKEEHDEEALEEAVERFKESDSFYEWQDGNAPAMNYLWPCEPRYQMSDDDAAAAIMERGGATALVTLHPKTRNDIQGIALTGGGMDLSWDICAAYICCGQIPPIRLLGDLPRYAGMHAGPMQLAILDCMKLAADWLKDRGERMHQERARIAEHLKVTLPAEPTKEDHRALISDLWYTLEHIPADAPDRAERISALRERIRLFFAD